jgi:hypothetical protein
MITPVKPPGAQPPPPSKILSSVPAHMRSELRASGTSSGHQNNGPVVHKTATPVMKGRTPAHTGLNTPITTPAHGSTSSISRQSTAAAPPQAPPERERKVSFAQPVTTTADVANTSANDASTSTNKPTTSSTTSNNKSSPPLPAPVPPAANANQELTDPDESYNFCSDDDAFYALVDLGEGSVLEEADLGRPIHGEDEEGDSRTPIYWGESSGGEDTTFGGGSNSGNGNGVVTESRADVGRRQGVQRDQGTSESASGIGMLSKLLPQNQQGLNNRDHRPSSHVVNQPSRNPPQHRQQQNHNHPPPQNQNIPPAQIGSALVSSSAAKKPPTPSMGGFHFPPGVVSPRSSSLSTFVD